MIAWFFDSKRFLIKDVDDLSQELHDKDKAQVHERLLLDLWQN